MRKLKATSTEVCHTCNKPNAPQGKENCWLSCEKCELWFHHSCQGINDEQFAFLDEDKNKDIATWICKGCRDGSVRRKTTKDKGKGEEDLRKMVEGIGKQLTNAVKAQQTFEVNLQGNMRKMQDNLTITIKESVKAEVTKLKTEIDGLSADLHAIKVEQEKRSQKNVGYEQQLKDLETRMQSWETRHTGRQEKVDKAPDGGNKSETEGHPTPDFKEEMREYYQQQLRCNNLVIRGLQQDINHSRGSVEKWLNKQLPDSEEDLTVKDILVIGETIPTVIRVTVCNGKIREMILRDIKPKLRNNQEQDKKKIIFVDPDLTRRQREEQKQLRLELREKRKDGGSWTIRNYKVVERDKDDRRQEL